MKCYLGTPDVSMLASERVLIYNGALEISFKKTKADWKLDRSSGYLPDTNGSFPLYAVDSGVSVSDDMKGLGGLLLPLHSSELMHVTFKTERAFAVVVRLAGINIISGVDENYAADNENGHIQRVSLNPRQDYIVLPKQKWLDLSTICSALLSRRACYGDCDRSLLLELEVVPMFGLIKTLWLRPSSDVMEEPQLKAKYPPLPFLNQIVTPTRPNIVKDIYPDTWDIKHSVKLNIHIIDPLAFHFWPPAKPSTPALPPQSTMPASSSITSTTRGHLIKVITDHRKTFSPISTQLLNAKVLKYETYLFDERIRWSKKQLPHVLRLRKLRSMKKLSRQHLLDECDYRNLNPLKTYLSEMGKVM